MYRIKKQFIKSLEAGLTEGINELNEKYQAVQLLPELRKKYPTQLREEIVSVRIYQTDLSCFLEITNLHPDSNDEEIGEIIEGDYSRKGYVSERTSLSFVSAGDALFFMLSATVLENAYNFLEVYDDRSKLETTNLFSEEGCKELIAQIDELEQNDTPSGDIYGELFFSDEDLKGMDGYDSYADPEALSTVDLSWSVDETDCIFYINEHPKSIKNDPYEKVDFTCDGIEYGFFRAAESKFYRIKIPVELIKQITLLCLPNDWGEYKTPKHYEAFVELFNGENLCISGDFNNTPSFENGIQEWGYYIHKVESIKE